MGTLSAVEEVRIPLKREAFTGPGRLVEPLKWEPLSAVDISRDPLNHSSESCTRLSTPGSVRGKASLASQAGARAGSLPR